MRYLLLFGWLVVYFTLVVTDTLSMADPEQWDSISSQTTEIEDFQAVQKIDPDLYLMDDQHDIPIVPLRHNLAVITSQPV